MKVLFQITGVMGDALVFGQAGVLDAGKPKISSKRPANVNVGWSWVVSRLPGWLF